VARANITPEPRKGKGRERKQSRPGKTVGKYNRPVKKGSRFKITVIIVLAIALVFLVVRLGRSRAAMEQMVRVPVSGPVQYPGGWS
jgi:hypothetical protein